MGSRCQALHKETSHLSFTHDWTPTSLTQPAHEPCWVWGNRELLGQAPGGTRLTGTLCHLFWGPMTTVVAEDPTATMNREQEPPGLQAMAVVHLLPLDIKVQRQPRLLKARSPQSSTLPANCQNLPEAGQAPQLQTRVPAQPPLTSTPLLGSHFRPKRP